MDGAFWLWAAVAMWPQLSHEPLAKGALELAPVSVRLSDDRIAFNPIRVLAEERVPRRSAREVP
jgi:hypothetical protein